MRANLIKAKRRYEVPGNNALQSKERCLESKLKACFESETFEFDITEEEMEMEWKIEVELKLIN